MKALFPRIIAGSLALALAGGCATRSGDQDAGTPRPDGGPATDGGPRPDGGARPDGGPATDGGPTAMDATIEQLQGATPPQEGTCVRVQGIVMSLVFEDRDNTFRPPDAGAIAKKSFYLSKTGIGTTEPRSGIQVVIDTDVTEPSVSPGDLVTVVAEYDEFFDLSTLRMTNFCGQVTRTGTGTMPTPATVTIAQIGQTANTAAVCPVPDGGSPTCTDGPNAEDYEGVLVRIQAGTVSSPRDQFGQFEVTDGTARLLVSTHFGLTVAPNVNDVVQSITGFGHFSFRRRKIRPRSDSEVMIQATPTSCGNDPKANHLLVTEVKLGPTAGEFVEIHNPTASAVDLSNYYLYSATFPGSTVDGGVNPERRYYNTVTGTQGGDCCGDFALRFPQGATIQPGEYQVIAITGAFNYCATYGCSTTAAKPNYEIPPPASNDADVADMRGVWDMAGTNFDTFGFLTSVGSGGEELVLFEWDGTATTVKDVDYVIWGSRQDQRTSKTGVAGYQPDTPIASQEPMAGSPSNSQSFQRVCLNEGTETKTGGNGLTGHNETSENLATTFVIRDPTPKAATAGAQP